MLEESLKTIHAGEVVEGTVIDVKPEEVILNIGYKSDGVLTRNEYTNDPSVDMTAVVKPGDKMEVKVLKVNEKPATRGGVAGFCLEAKGVIRPCLYRRKP